MNAQQKAAKQTDAELRRDVAAELGWNPSIRDEEVAVAVKDGVVTLAGTVESFAQKRTAVRVAERLQGVRAIADDLEVKLPNDRTRTDTELAHAAVNALRWHVEVPADRVKVAVAKGWLTLEGDVEWKYQRDAAERAVRDLTGVRGVSNAITLKPSVSSSDVAQRIKAALRRRAELDASKIEVETIDGIVTLNGTVRNWTERADAESAVWAAPGVIRVEDRLTVRQ